MTNELAPLPDGFFDAQNDADAALVPDPSKGWKISIVGEGIERADQLQAHSQNWRVHPQNQQTATKAALEKLGWIDSVIVNQRTGNLLNGHMRVQLALREGDDTPVPVKYVDISEQDELYALAVIDPLAAMAVEDEASYGDLVSMLDEDNRRLVELLSVEQPFEENPLDLHDNQPADNGNATDDRPNWMKVMPGDVWRCGEEDDGSLITVGQDILLGIKLLAAYQTISEGLEPVLVVRVAESVDSPPSEPDQWYDAESDDVS